MKTLFLTDTEIRNIIHGAKSWTGWLPKSLERFRPMIEDVSDEREDDSNLWLYTKPGLMNHDTGNHMVAEQTVGRCAEQFRNVGRCGCDDQCHTVWGDAVVRGIRDGSLPNNWEVIERRTLHDGWKDTIHFVKRGNPSGSGTLGNFIKS